MKNNYEIGDMIKFKSRLSKRELYGKIIGKTVVSHLLNKDFEYQFTVELFNVCVNETIKKRNIIKKLKEC